MRPGTSWREFPSGGDDKPMVVTWLLLAAFLFISPQTSPSSYKGEVEHWRQERETALKAADGWLTVVGLFWLKEGKNTMGTDRANDFVLPKGSAPGKVGVFEFHNGSSTFLAAPGADATVDGKPVTQVALKPDTSGSPDVLRIRDLSMYVIQRGNRFGIRLKDKNSEARREFKGTQWFPAKSQYRVVARFVPYNPPKMIAIPSILGDVDQEASPGYAEFRLNGHRCRLDPIGEGDSLFFIFKDKTSGKETYPPGRFLFAEMPKNGEVILDFNKAVNPPCAFTPYATCPLPPKQNDLPIAIAAGELRYGH
jgi:uncharacterized protein (DUF1684 family)